jgi:hypothetical protein
MWALFDRWRPFDRWTEKRGFPLPPPPSRAHPSVQAVLPDSRDQHPRPTAHARLTGHGQCPCASHICCRSTPDHPRPSAEGSRRDRTSPLSPSVSRVARGAQPRARILGGVMHVRAASRFLNPRPEDLVHPRAFSRCSCSQYPTGLVIPAPNAAPPCLVHLCFRLNRGLAGTVPTSVSRGGEPLEWLAVLPMRGASQCLATHTLPRGVERGRTKST